MSVQTIAELDNSVSEDTLLDSLKAKLADDKAKAADRLAQEKAQLAQLKADFTDLQSKNKILQNDSNALVQLKASYEQLVNESNKVSTQLATQIETTNQLTDKLASTTTSLEEQGKKAASLGTTQAVVKHHLDSCKAEYELPDGPVDQVVLSFVNAVQARKHASQ